MDSVPKKQYNAMSKAYWKLWNPEVQAKIDADIEANRKADGKFSTSAKAGTKVKVEQISHQFIFGAHIFNFDQLGTDERNEKYKDLYGTLFNSATIALYWKTLEPVEGQARYAAEYRDSAEFWNTVKEPKMQPHWRRPAPDPVVDFCLKKGIRLHGHPLVWGNYKWHYPDWLYENHLPEGVKAMMPKTWSITDWSPLAEVFNNDNFTAEQIANLAPEFAVRLETTMAKRIAEIAFRYGDKITSWDVCNESACDFAQGCMVPGSAICKCSYGLMPGDYTYRAFKLAESMLPASAKLNINDYYMKQAYPDQVNDLVSRGCKIDIMGAQMHLFNPQICLDIADGKSQQQSPENVWSDMNMLSEAGKPIHLSEITITAPNNDERGQAIQAVMTRNLYRLWFSYKNMMGITWWNVVDDCGAPGEPSVSGLFSRNMEPKPAYFVLDDLINHEWKTNLEVKAGAKGQVSFRGFRGTYRLSWTGADGKKQQKTVTLE